MGSPILPDTGVNILSRIHSSNSQKLSLEDAIVVLTMTGCTSISGVLQHSICMLQRNMVLRQRLKDCTTVGAPSQAEVWLYDLNPPPPPPPPPPKKNRATHLGHRPLVRSTFIIFRTPPFPDLATGLALLY